MSIVTGEKLDIDWAVFTAIRSPMGVGYRIVAQTVGVTADEQREIVRSAPSNGSLNSDAPDATSLASLTLSNGRHCLLVSRHAGPEQTARGGFRVLTHVLLLKPEQFNRFAANPVAIEAAALMALGSQLLEVPSASKLEPLTLTCRPTVASRWDAAFDSIARQPGLLATVAALLQGEPTIVLGAAEQRQVLQTALLLTPAVLRRRLSLSCGLKLSPSRKFGLVLTEAKPSEVRRVGGENGRVIDWEAAEAVNELSPWLTFLQQRINDGHGRDVNRMTADLTTAAGPEILTRVVRMIEDIEQVPTANATRLDELSSAHLNASEPSELPASLCDELRLAVVARRAELAREEEAARKAAEAAAAEAAAAEAAATETSPEAAVEGNQV